ncbi:hypothetical protein P280DRAFT_163159 [Massarina eburnea CBS 473.64]|uniref:Uncharacterized protein n=1 Tax=Massarina eburnea CBS 473.64 TaxID=1395130 RepID=A0A6A6RNC5_9PLEO|nr:hypothetical protein P280DRAFT_163159 [Massarina eburnea CBS 473.64]
MPASTQGQRPLTFPAASCICSLQPVFQAQYCKDLSIPPPNTASPQRPPATCTQRLSDGRLFPRKRTPTGSTDHRSIPIRFCERMLEACHLVRSRWGWVLWGWESPGGRREH